MMTDYMGYIYTGIAQVSAEKGYRVLLKDRDLTGVSKGEKYINDNLQVINRCLDSLPN